MTKNMKLKTNAFVLRLARFKTTLLRPGLVLSLGALIIAAGIFTAASLGHLSPFLCPAVADPVALEYATTPTQLLAILHYATTKEVPQQSNAEVRVTFDVLRELAPCNFLVYGVGRDSLMWASLNPRGTTLFLEEDPEWLKAVLLKAPILRAKAVKYHTHLSQADELISTYRYEPECLPSSAPLSRESRCKLALTEMPEEVYGRDWDLIMIDAPRGYYAAAPGRMAAIYSAAVMARARRSPGVTHVFLHDVNRRVERMYADEFLCQKFLVKEVGRLWHFAIPSATNVTDSESSFCS